jgi:hypothetical protein
METFWFIWLAAAAVTLVAMYAVKCLRERRLAGVRELYWPTLLTVCLIAGGIAAFLHQATSSRQVEVPPEVQEKIALPPRN